MSFMLANSTVQTSVLYRSRRSNDRGAHRVTLAEFREAIQAMPALAAAVSKLPSTFTKANNLLTCLSVTNSDSRQELNPDLGYCR
jgi:hypothetical protein